MNTLCDWPVDYSSCSSCQDFAGLPPAEREKFERMAGEYLWNWTNRVFGVCDVTLRPCTSDCDGARVWTDTFWGRGPFPWTGDVSSGSWVPLLIAGKWYNLGCGCVGTCSCAVEGPKSLALPGPVASVTSVKIDGVELAPENYSVMYNRFLVRTDGEVWPSCQDLLAPSTEANTFEVIYKKGIPVPVGGQFAAALLASEYYKAFCGDRNCALPKRMQQIVRQDVTVTLVDDFANMKKDGSTGIWVIDNWVASVTAPRPYASVRSVDVKPRAVTRGY